MRTTAVLLVSLLWCCESAAQGWAHFGPDSSGWQYVEELNVRWFGTDSLYLAASTYPAVSAGGAIALKLADRQWDYTLLPIGDGTYMPYASYKSLQFSPWESDSAFLSFDIIITDPSPLILKIPVPCPYHPIDLADLVGSCFVSHPSRTFFPVEGDSILYANICWGYRAVKPWRTWVPVHDFGYPIPMILALDRTKSSTIWSSLRWSAPPLIIRSSDSGTSWDTVTSFPFLPECRDMVVSGDTILLAQWSVGDSTAFKGIVQSKDGGRTWSPRYAQSGISVLQWGRGNTVFAGGQSGIIVSEDAGWTWRTFNNGLPETHLTDIAVSPYSDTLFVSTLDYGVLKVWNYVVGVGPELLPPKKFALEQNYPNPFNPSTTIKFELPQTSHVSLTVYDILGRQVSVLVNERKAPGSYSVTFDGSHLASGVYFYRLIAGSFSETKRLLLIR